jgi:hypothetical protein
LGAGTNVGTCGNVSANNTGSNSLIYRTS